MKTASESHERHQKLCKENARIFSLFVRAKILQVGILHPHEIRTHSIMILNIIQCHSMIRYASCFDCFQIIHTF